MPDVASKSSRVTVFKRALAAVPGVQLDPASVDKAGSVANVLAAAAAAVAEEVERRCMVRLAALTLATAQGTDLEAAVAERTNGDVARLRAAPATVPVWISRAGVGPLLAGPIPAGTLLVAGPLQFALDVPVSFSASQPGPIQATATCTSAGSSTNIAQGALTGFVNPSSLFDAYLRATNVDPNNVKVASGAGGDDVELDGAYRERARGWPSSVQRATLEALRFAAQQVAGVKQAVCVESLDANGLPSGPVVLYVADANGQANDALVARVQQQLRAYRGAGVPVRVIGAIPRIVSITLSLGYLDGFAQASVQAQVVAAVVAAVNRTPPGAVLARDVIRQAILTVPGVVTRDTSIVQPAADLVPATPGTTYRATPSSVTFGDTIPPLSLTVSLSRGVFG